MASAGPPTKKALVASGSNQSPTRHPTLMTLQVPAPKELLWVSRSLIACSKGATRNTDVRSVLCLHASGTGYNISAGWTLIHVNHPKTGQFGIAPWLRG
jgi:hypothetical protein